MELLYYVNKSQTLSKTTPDKTKLYLLIKKVGHKYLKRTPYVDNKGRRRYRYYYYLPSVRGGLYGDFKEGDKIKAKDKDGKFGHYHIKRDDKGNLYAEHDETGHKIYDFKELKRLTYQTHKEAIETKKKKLEHDIEMATKNNRQYWSKRLKDEYERFIKLYDTSDFIKAEWENWRKELIHGNRPEWILDIPYKAFYLCDEINNWEYSFMSDKVDTLWDGWSSRQRNVMDKIEDKLYEWINDSDNAKLIYEISKKQIQEKQRQEHEQEENIKSILKSIPKGWSVKSMFKKSDIKNIEKGFFNTLAEAGLLLSRNASFVEKVLSTVKSRKQISDKQYDVFTKAFDYVDVAKKLEPNAYLLLYQKFSNFERQKLEIESEENNKKKELLESQQNSDWEEPNILKKEKLIGGKLHPYQAKGVNWLDMVDKGLLGFDTGLGKTLMSIAYTAKQIELGKMKKVVIVSPKSLIKATWENEFKKWTKDMNVLVYHGTKRHKITKDEFDKADVIITSYGALNNEKDLAKIKDIAENNGNGIIFDEATRLKNYKAKRTKAALKINSKKKILLTATPITNTPLDLYSLMNQINPDVLGGIGQFKKEFCETEDIWTGRKRQNIIVGFKNLKNLRNKIQPYVFMKYRSDADVELNLPQYTQLNPSVSLDDDSKRVYKGLIQDMEIALSSKDSTKLLVTLNKMRQASIHPGLIEPKLEAKTSAKFDNAIQFLNEHFTNDPNHGVAMFCEYKKALNLFQKHVNKNKDLGFKEDDIAILSGELSTKKRNELVEKFNNGDLKVLLLTTAAAGEGLNLQKNANAIYHLNTPWSPALLKQADDRVNRQGQKNKVVSVRPIMENTIEQVIEERIYKKQEYAKTLVDAKGHMTNLITSDKGFLDALRRI